MGTTLEGISFSATVRVEPLSDPITEALGHDARSDYVERFWLPVLGPSTTWLVRYLSARLDAEPGGCTIEIAATARALGLGERAGRHGPFLRSVARAIDFDMAALVEPGRIALRRWLPSLSPRHLARLPEHLQLEHRDVMESSSSPHEQQRRRGQQLALSLLELGEGADDAVSQLVRWRFHPSLAHQCASWASRELQRRTSSTPLRGGADELGGAACRPPAPAVRQLRASGDR